MAVICVCSSSADQPRISPGPTAMIRRLPPPSRVDVERNAPRHHQEHILRHVALAEQHLPRLDIAHPRHVGDLQQMLVVEVVQKPHLAERLDHCLSVHASPVSPFARNSSRLCELIVVRAIFGQSRHAVNSRIAIGQRPYFCLYWCLHKLSNRLVSNRLVSNYRVWCSGGAAMNWEAWFTLAVVVGILIMLVRESLPTDIVMVGALTLLVAVGEMRHSDMLPSIAQAVAGMGNTGLITVGVLFVVVAGLVQTGAMELVAGPIIGQPKTARSALCGCSRPSPRSARSSTTRRSWRCSCRSSKTSANARGSARRSSTCRWPTRPRSAASARSSARARTSSCKACSIEDGTPRHAHVRPRLGRRAVRHRRHRLLRDLRRSGCCPIAGRRSRRTTIRANTPSR